MTNKFSTSSIFITIFILGFLLAAGFFIVSSLQDQTVQPMACQLDELPTSAKLTINDRGIDLFVATSASERSQGLSECQRLPQDTGILFMFDQAGQHSFWMKDMYFSIDIIWVAEDDEGSFTVVHIKNDAHPESFPESFKSAKNAKYVLELPDDFVESEEIKIGDNLDLEISLTN